jgi:phosphohistidine phosphatase
MRHAKSDWNSDAPSDHARPLNKRGRHDAPRIARRLAKLGWIPEAVISSDSQRTRETFELMVDHFAADTPVRFLESLYHAGPRELAAALELVPDKAQTVLALGHNPGWSSAVIWLTGQDVLLTTANAVLCHVDADSWPAAVQRAGDWKLDDVLRPKEL